MISAELCRGRLGRAPSGVVQRRRRGRWWGRRRRRVERRVERRGESANKVFRAGGRSCRDTKIDNQLAEIFTVSLVYWYTFLHLSCLYLFTYPW